VNRMCLAPLQTNGDALPLHTQGELSSLESVNVHIRIDNAARLKVARARGKYAWEERICPVLYIRKITKLHT
jgi:hypothetical protein